MLWPEECGGLQSMGLQRDTDTHTHTYMPPPTHTHTPTPLSVAEMSVQAKVQVDIESASYLENGERLLRNKESERKLGRVVVHKESLAFGN